MQAQQLKLLEIGRQLLTIPIGNPDPAPKRQYQKRKTHGKADARGLTGAEIVQKELKARETQAHKGQARKPQAPKIPYQAGGRVDRVVYKLLWVLVNCRSQPKIT